MSDVAESSQTLKAQLRLRELIIGGELAAGERVPELALVERLGVSRTPVRSALAQLQTEGLLEALPGGGYAVRGFTETEVHDAIEVRGTMEGLAARLAAERGVPASLLSEMRQCVAAIDDVLAAPALDDASFGRYVEANARFHALLAEAAGSAVVRRQVFQAAALPFASPNAFVLARETGPRARDVLVVAQEQHRMLLQAIEQREGARAEALMREHARIAHQNLREALVSREGLHRVPGAALIRRNNTR
jgi:GntR family transcriptional regulator, vanillate catabolism transcriptional regulator